MTKVFLATYVNMAIVALVAYGYLRNKPALAKQVGDIEIPFVNENRHNCLTEIFLILILIGTPK